MRLLIPLVFFALAALFLADTLPGKPAVESTPAFDRSALDTGPPRTPMADPPTTEIGGFSQRCSSCHAGFPSRKETPERLMQHQALIHDHGMNDRCFNCHDQGDHDSLVLHDGSTVSFDEVEALCSKCHGTVFRDWERGMHGRTQGAWDPASALQSRLTCTQCHDPHAPAMKPIKPLPGPRTFRMGEVLDPADAHEEPTDNPLRRGWPEERQESQ